MRQATCKKGFGAHSLTRRDKHETMGSGALLHVSRLCTRNSSCTMTSMNPFRTKNAMAHSCTELKADVVPDADIAFVGPGCWNLWTTGVQGFQHSRGVALALAGVLVCNVVIWGRSRGHETLGAWRSLGAVQSVTYINRRAAHQDLTLHRLGTMCLR